MRALHTQQVEADVRKELGGRVAVSGEGDHVFLYADTEPAVQAARTVVEAVLAEDSLTGDLKVDRWHHEEERWEDAGVPMPTTGAAEADEHAQLEEDEEAESEQSGIADWEVRVELPSHHDARTLAERLEGEGMPCVRRWTYLLVGAGDEDDANALAGRLQAEAPGGTTVHVEPGSGLAWRAMPANPFAVFGGLGG
jgi:hypothetical protein